ncbi:hypothetical protein Vse01_57660 [Micromonospora sediminimaris]|uniref:Uncharacterized protein n=1 Tax=Micromonospora sediminimaris TaxID=547162 RepID=A0A9W5XN77_9ACTN|nr:hypothetical protein Vse01_57660 [Micromonospora sediminimaris]
MLRLNRKVPVHRQAASPAGHGLSLSLACCSNNRRQAWVSNGGSACRVCQCEDVDPGSGRRGWPTIALCEM